MVAVQVYCMNCHCRPINCLFDLMNVYDGALKRRSSLL